MTVYTEFKSYMNVLEKGLYIMLATLELMAWNLDVSKKDCKVFKQNNFRFNVTVEYSS